MRYISILFISRLLLSVYFVSSVLLFVFSEGYVRDLLLMMVLGASLLAFLQEKRNSLWILVVLILLGVLSFSIINKIYFDKTPHFTVLINICASFFFSFVLWMRRELIATFYLLYYALAVVLLFLLMAGVDANNIFAGSRNTISEILVCLGAFFLLANYNNRKILDVALYIIVFLCSILAIGRSGIITSFILLVALFFRFWAPLNYGKLILGFFAVLAFSVLLLYAYESYSYFDYMKNKGLDDGYRTKMLSEYISHMDVKGLLFGLDLVRLPYISSFNKNPHNTFLMLHSQYGVFAMVFFFLLCLCFFNFIREKSFVAAVAFCALAFRLATDTSTGITSLPLVYCFVSFLGYFKLRLGKEKVSLPCRTNFLSD